jgi:hypothetical protein
LKDIRHAVMNVADIWRFSFRIDRLEQDASPKLEQMRLMVTNVVGALALSKYEFLRLRTQSVLLESQSQSGLMASSSQLSKKLTIRQSRTLPQAVIEYKRRYGRSPPKGFEAWWQFTKKNGVKIVDDVSVLPSTLTLV